MESPVEMLLTHFNEKYTESDRPGHWALSWIRSIVHCWLIRVLRAVAIVLACGSPSPVQCVTSPLKAFVDPMGALHSITSCLVGLCLVIAVASASADVTVKSIVIPGACAQAVAMQIPLHGAFIFKSAAA